MKSDIEEQVYALINDFEIPDAGPSHTASGSAVFSNFDRTHPGKFPVKAILRAVPAVKPSNVAGVHTSAVQERIYMRPLLTSGDILLAMHELLDGEVFKCGSITLPHTLRGPFVRDGHSGSYFRCVYRLNNPIVVYQLKAKQMESAGGISVNGNHKRHDVRSFLCPRYHQDVSIVEYATSTDIGNMCNTVLCVS